MTTILSRRGSAAAWTSVNPILAMGERGLETDTGKEKIGNGSLTWTALGYTLDSVASIIQPIIVKSTSFNVAANEAGSLYLISSSASIVVTVPTGLTIGQTFLFKRGGTGSVTFASANVSQPSNLLTIARQGSFVAGIMEAANTLALVGDLA